MKSNFSFYHGRKLLYILILCTISTLNAFGQSCPDQGTILFPNLKGQELLTALVTEYKTLSTPGYNTAREILYGEIDNQDGYVIGIYTGYKGAIDPEAGNPRSQANSVSINAEHTWPQSKGASGIAKSDMHHLHPTYSNANSARGNHPFYEIPDEKADSWWRNTDRVTTPTAEFIDEYSEKMESHPNPDYESAWEPREDIKGDVARGMFYFYTMYKSQADAADPNFFNVQKDFFRIWNQMDGVSDREYYRTCAIAPHQQGKVNPFVIDPTLVNRAYFDGVGTQTNIQFAATALTINEAQNVLEVDIIINNPNPDTSTTIDVVYAGGTAEMGIDFAEFSTESLTFPAGSYAKQTISLTIYDDDELEENETIILALENIKGPTEAVIGIADMLTITIRDNDGDVPTNIWVNEFHYDNAGADEGEFIEIAVDGESADLSEFTLTLYNGSNGSSYSTVKGSDFIEGESQNGITLYYVDFPPNGIQNGSPDGISLDIGGEVIQFISYEGVMIANNGPAENLESVDIGIAQSGNEPVGSSLQLTGTGRGYSSFSWLSTDSHTKGKINTGQEFSVQTSVEDENLIADRVHLHQNYPNPFNPVTNIQFELKDPAQVTLSVYNVLGRKVATLVEGRRSAGLHSITFDASELASGIYFYQLQAGDQLHTQKMLLSK